ncbi:hypothetical protein H0G86_002736 [Trichoderma simmonsii]|uniref:Heparan-alpha-glucosaminide N-acetyltransferase catalytic domain-containing protein n=1 Tax=Trichoderma simmonsii TaxID=1491479 RepID=A0A8G0PDQ5_9HYPO|nr:hypothetical protein H0G86_002736 [Trichoderma simmonsii]
MASSSEASARSENGYRYDSITDPNASASSRTESPSLSSSPVPIAKQPTVRLLAPDLQRGLLMALMAMDHLALGLNTWQHGTNIDGEMDGLIVRRWNFTTAYIVRTLTHFCAPGFTFLLGMGVVLLSQSRTRIGWSAGRLMQYYAVRGLVLTAVTWIIGLVSSGGQFWFLNVVLFSLGVDYVLAGMLWLLMDRTEKWLGGVLERGLLIMDKRSGAVYVPTTDDDEDEEGGVSQPLLLGRRHAARESERAATASSLSWHIHNIFLVALSVITIWWNIWLSEDHGRCNLDTEGSDGSVSTQFVPTSKHPLLAIWFWYVASEHVMSNFPPMAWLSFAILGLLYGRIISARKWTISAVAIGHASAGVIFAAIFVLTRLLRVGNLSEDCLHTPAQDAQTANENPYLASAASFFYIIKYPPDVAFWAFTMAGNLFMLGAFSSIPVHVAKRFGMLLSFGTSSLFFYVVHLNLVMSPLGTLLKNLFGTETGHGDPMHPGNTKGIANLFVYFIFWVLLLLIMWPACFYYSRFKSTRHADSLWRFF